MGDKQQPGPIYDNALKRLMEVQLGGVCEWLGFGSADIVVESEELPAYGQRVDMLVRIDERRLAQVEVFRCVDSSVLARMVEYLARIWQRYPDCEVEQHIVQLGGGDIVEEYRRDSLTVRFHVHKLNEVDPAELLRRPATMPLAVLAKAPPGGYRQLLREVLETIAKSGSPDTTTLLEIAETLARVHLPLDEVIAIGREARMPFDLSEFPPSPGIIQAYADGEAKILGIMLRSRFGDDPRIDRIASRLAEGDPEQAFRAASRTTSLDALDS